MAYALHYLPDLGHIADDAIALGLDRDFPYLIAIILAIGEKTLHRADLAAIIDIRCALLLLAILDDLAAADRVISLTQLIRLNHPERDGIGMERLHLIREPEDIHRDGVALEDLPDGPVGKMSLPCRRKGAI